MGAIRRWAHNATKAAGEIVFALLILSILAAIFVAVTWPLWAGLAAIKFLFA